MSPTLTSRLTRYTRVLCLVALTSLGGGHLMAQVTAYPSRPVRIIVPFPPGQGTDVATRHLAEQLSKSTGQNFLVDNRPGAASRLGMELLAKAAPDGYTLGVGTAGTHTINPNVFPNLGYDPEKDFEPICLTGLLPLMFAAHPGFSANNMSDMIAAAKSKPDTLNVALPAMPQRIAFELFRQQSGAPLFAIPYKGSSTALQEVIGGQVPLIVDSLTALRPLIESGKLKALGVTSLKSSELMPGVKSVAEQGTPGYELTAWNAFFAPKGTPAAIVQQLNTELRRILQQPETRQRMSALGFDIVGSTPQQLAETVRIEREKWGVIIRANNIQAD
jgi:tripartite-type tricarboxylate transporter receptor subunit TctC